MSNDFNIDNAGSGFDLDDEDLDVMMSKASQGEQDRENGSEFNVDEQPSAPVNNGPMATSLEEADAQIAAQEERSTAQDQPVNLTKVDKPEEDEDPFAALEESDSEEFEDGDFSEEEPIAQVEEFEEEPQPEPVTPPQRVVEPAQEPYRVPAPSAPARDKMHIPSAEDELRRINLVLAIADACRSLSKDDRDIVGQFLTQGEEVKTEGELVLQVLTSSPTVRTGIKHIKQAKALDAVERAFYVIELTDSDLYNVGDLIAIFSDEEPNRSSSRTQYARQLVKCIEQLDTMRMQYIEAIQSVLAVLEEKR